MSQLLLSDEFLCALVEAARHYGHDGDYVAVTDFVNYCMLEAGHEKLTEAQLTPYRIEDDA